MQVKGGQRLEKRIIQDKVSCLLTDTLLRYKTIKFEFELLKSTGVISHLKIIRKTKGLITNMRKREHERIASF